MKPSSKCHLIVVGAQKAGTTWLHNTLEYQDEFWCPHDRQEIHYFDRYYEKGYTFYKDKYSYAPKESITFDVTPNYLCHPLVPNRIDTYKIVSKRPIKIISLLRNPIERAISAYRMKFKKGAYGNIPLSKAVNIDTSLINESKYEKPLLRYMKIFDSDDIKVFIMENVFRDTDKFLDDLRTFVGLEGSIDNPYRNTKINESDNKGASYPAIRVGAKMLRYIGWKKIIHLVKKTYWSRLLRKK